MFSASMSALLVSLHHRDVTLRLLDPFGLLRHDAEGAPPTAAMVFHRQEDAADYLRSWLRLGGAMSVFRAALARFEPASPLWSFSDEHVLQLLAARLHRGSIVALESAAPLSLSAVSSGSAPASSSAAANAAAAAAFQATPIAAPAAPDTPVLPILEEVQIEGAEVLPEVEATLANLDASMATINLASVSLEPAPSGVPAISSSMSDASGAVSSTLDEL